LDPVTRVTCSDLIDQPGEMIIIKTGAIKMTVKNNGKIYTRLHSISFGTRIYQSLKTKPGPLKIFI